MPWPNAYTYCIITVTLASGSCCPYLQVKQVGHREGKSLAGHSTTANGQKMDPNQRAAPEAALLTAVVNGD